MRINRFPENPLITPADVKPSRDDFEVICVFNAAVTRYNDEVLLLMRVAERPKTERRDCVLVPMLDNGGESNEMKILCFEHTTPGIDFTDSRIIFAAERAYLTSISHFRIARSKDGRHFTVEGEPWIMPHGEAESYGIEDPRITLIDGVYYIVYKSVSANGICQSLITTRDFIQYERHGIILAPENMDAMIFPEKINGKFALIHRPFPCMIGSANIWISYSEDAIHWGEHQYLAGVETGGWEGGRIGGSVVPFMTDRGWLEIYHGATPEHKYSLGAMLLDANDPAKVIARSKQPIMEPEAPYEVSGFVPNVVFSCGALVDGDKITLYYGGADTVMAGAEMSVKEILDSLE